MKSLVNLFFLISLLSFAQPNDLGYELNGSNDYLIVPNTSYINTGGTVYNRTVETWFKANNTSSRQVIFEEGGGVNAIIIYLEENRLYCGAYKSNGSSAGFFRSANEDINDDMWYHVAFVINSSEDDSGSANGETSFSWYLNGELQDSINGFAIPQHSGDVQLGRNGKLRYANCGSWYSSSVNNSDSENCSTATSAITTKNYFDGNIWGFRIWNSGRTSTEINDNINSELSSGTNLAAYLDGDTIHYLNNSATWVEARANGNDTTYTWEGGANTSNWSNPENWKDENAPLTNNLRKIKIKESDHYPVISSEVKIGELEVHSDNAEITIEDGGTLNVYYKVINNGTIRVKNNGSFILQDNESVSGEGTFIIERDTPDYPEDYYSIWSTPVTESDSEIGTIFDNAIIAYKYDASQNPSAYVQVGTAHEMEVGSGYFVRSDNDSGILTRTFTGNANNGTIDKAIYHNSNTDNFNLIGNPYTSAIDWVSFYKENSEILEGTAYLWSQSTVGPDNSASDYISYNTTGSNDIEANGKIPTGQGFFVKSKQSGIVQFKNTHRIVGNNDQFSRTSNTDDGKSWFRLSGSMGYSPILIGFVPGATDGYESTYDAEFLNEGADVEFYSLIDEAKFDIQGRSELQPNQLIQIPLGFEVKTAGDYTISKVLEYIDPSFEILLEDTLENTMTDLRLLDYTFNVSAPTEDNNRFIIHYNYNQTLSSVEFVEDSNNLSSFFLNNNLITKVKNEDSPLTIQMFDISGKEILKSDFRETIQTQNLPSGIYIVKYSFENSNASLTKKVIKS